VGHSCKIDSTLDSDLYVEILESELVDTIDYYNLDKEEIIFQQDNAPCHTSKTTMEAFNAIEVNVMDWPAQSPDLNPIENYWGHVA
jgi:hypothetical protein